MPYPLVRSICAPFVLACAITGCGELEKEISAPSADSGNSQSAGEPNVAVGPGESLTITPPATDQQDSEQSPLVPTKRIVEPNVTLLAEKSGDESTDTKLIWSSENVENCVASGAWEGQRPAAGNDNVVHSEGGDHTFALTCEGPHGTAMAMVTVDVDAAALAWVPPAANTNGSELTDLAGYNLYYGTEPGRYTETMPVRDASVTSLDLPVSPGVYYIAMTAYDFDGNESALSNEIRRIVD